MFFVSLVFSDLSDGGGHNKFFHIFMKTLLIFSNGFEIGLKMKMIILLGLKFQPLQSQLVAMKGLWGVACNIHQN